MEDKEKHPRDALLRVWMLIASITMALHSCNSHQEDQRLWDAIHEQNQAMIRQAEQFQEHLDQSSQIHQDQIEIIDQMIQNWDLQIQINEQAIQR